MKLSVTKNEDSMTIRLPDVFGFGLRKEFKQVINDVYPGITCILDLREVTKIDSSALGMLLMFREAAGGEKSDIKIINAKPEILRLLSLANFGRLFKTL